MKETAKNGPKWTSIGWSNLAIGDSTPAQRHAAVAAPSQLETTTAGGRLGDRHIPGDRRPLGLG